MPNFRIVDVVVDIPGVQNPDGGSRLQLKLSILNLDTREISTENVKYISSVVKLLEDDSRFDADETPAVLHMICKKLSMPINHTRDLDEEMDLAQEFIKDAQKYINLVILPVIFVFEVEFEDIENAHITAKYCIHDNDSYQQIHSKNIEHLVQDLKNLGFSTQQIIKALKILIYDFSRFLDLNKKNYNFLDESAKISFKKDAELKICNLITE